MQSKTNILPILSGILTSSIFGLSFLFSKKALNIVEPFTLLSFRFLVAFLIMSMLIFVKVIKVNYKGKNIKNLFFLGLMQPIIYFIFETYGIQFSSSSQAGLMIALIPIVVTILSAYALKETPSKLQCAFIFLSVSGVIFIVLMNGSSSSGGSLLGILLLLGAVLSAAVFNILSRKYSEKFSPMELTYAMMAMGAVFFNFVSILNNIRANTLTQYFSPLKNSDFLISLGYLGILSSIIAFFLINFTLSRIEASKAAIFSNLSTIVSIIAGVILLHENFKLYHFIGSILILVGVWGTNYYSKKSVLMADI
ncbi:DMT family transporter [Clostridium sp. CS001]|uniref:DMT family transporter n=1 Tax=Clostridium sp. CS001 TaxID=2880648 RepID=UPI001CF5E10A|nr:DMT family transporter [Clostridium sp. CS001]MCB2291407.1 DMT family transporter [Clostridium sp. CS001]